MLREIYIDKFNKIVTDYRQEVFATLTAIDKKPYEKDITVLRCVDGQETVYQVYVTHKNIKNWENIVFLETSPKILLLLKERLTIIIQERVIDNLYDYQASRESSMRPYFSQKEIAHILTDISACLQDYHKHKMEYNNIHPKNIVCSKQHRQYWSLSLPGLVLEVEQHSIDYYNADLKGEHGLVYALGSLLFKLTFGFVPFEKQKKKPKFSFDTYLKYLDVEQNKKLMKVYYFAERSIRLSDLIKRLIEESLSGTMGFEAWINHSIFHEDTKLNEPTDDIHKQVRMLAHFGPSNQSIVMAAIQRRKKSPEEKLNSKVWSDYDQLSYQEVINSFQKNEVLSQLHFSKDFDEEEEVNYSNTNSNLINFKPEESPAYGLPYFYEQSFDIENDFPCRELIKLINKDKEKHSDIVDAREHAIKRYAYPYAMVFELAKVAPQQPVEIRKKMTECSQLLLQVSTLFRAEQLKPLHETKCNKTYEQLKPKYRERINELYKHFLMKAMKKYNMKQEGIPISERIRQKKQGLEYYRLCWKLLEASLIVRKQGKNLHLECIETSQRRDIEKDLSQLLKHYFPNKFQV